MIHSLVSWAVNRPIAVFVLTLALGIFGLRAWQQLETALLPDLEYPEYFIVTHFPGGSPEEMEQLVSKPLEEVLASLPGIQDIISSSREGVSLIEVQFDWGIDFRFTLLRIREKIDAI
ncbi:MAG: acriflavin resistance protein, partial [Candidatus Marinimicrobia bacterium CG_4_9_14_3_um_filter_48_9]